MKYKSISIYLDCCIERVINYKLRLPGDTFLLSDSRLTQSRIADIDFHN